MLCLNTMTSQREYSEVSDQSVYELLQLGESYQSQGLDDKALASFEKALSLEPQNDKALMSIVLHHLRTGALEVAFEHFAKLLETHEDSAATHVVRALLHNEEGARRSEIIDYERVLDIDPNHREALFNLAAVYLESDRIEAAEEKIKRLKVLFPKDGLLSYLEGLLRAKQSRTKEEILCYQRAMEILPDEAMIAYNLGIALLESQGPEQALEPLKRAFDLDSKSLDVVLNLASCYYELGNYDEAILVLRNATVVHEDSPELWYDLGYVLASKSESREAIKAYEMAVSLDDTMADAHYNLAFIYFSLSEYEKAIAGYKRVLQLEADRFKALYNLAYAYDYCHRYEEAIETYKATLNFRPDDHKTYSKLARVYSHLKDWQKVKNACVRSLEMERVRNPEAHYYLALVAEHEEDWKTADKEFKKALSQSPNFKDAHVRRAIACRRLGNFEEAKQEAKEAIRYRASASAYYELGRAYGELGDERKAAAAFEKVLEFDEGDVKSIIALADQRVKQGKLEEAISLCREKIAKGIESPPLHYHLALALEVEGDMGESIAEAKRAARLDENYAEAYALIARIYGKLDESDKSNKYLSKYRQLKGKSSIKG